MISDLLDQLALGSVTFVGHDPDEAFIEGK